MSKLRSLLVWLIFVPFTFVWFIPVLISALWPPRKRHRMGALWNATLVYLLSKIVGLRYRVSGLEHIENKPMVICCKHQSGYETLALQRFLPDQVFVIKKELLWFPLFGISLYVMNSIPIDRHRKTAQSREKLMRAVKKRKEQGFWINIFPEGTRVKPGHKDIIITGQRASLKPCRWISCLLPPIVESFGGKVSLNYQERLILLLAHRFLIDQESRKKSCASVKRG